MQEFFVSHAVSYVDLTGNKAKYFPSRLFVVKRQYESGELVIAGVLCVSFSHGRPLDLVYGMPAVCTYTTSYTATGYVS